MKAVIVKIPKLRTVLERTRESLESFIDREQVNFRFGSYCADNINTLLSSGNNIWSSDTRSDLLFFDFQKVVDSVKESYLVCSIIYRRRILQKRIAVFRATNEVAKWQVMHQGKISEETLPTYISRQIVEKVDRFVYMYRKCPFCQRWRRT